MVSNGIHCCIFSFQSGQYLLNLGGGAAAGADDEDYDDDEGIYEQQLERDQSGCCAPLEKVPSISSEIDEDR